MKPSQIEIKNEIGIWRIDCPFPAVSLQADSLKKQDLQDKIKVAISSVNSVFVGAIEIDILSYYTADYFY